MDFKEDFAIVYQKGEIGDKSIASATTKFFWQSNSHFDNNSRDNNAHIGLSSATKFITF